MPRFGFSVSLIFFVICFSCSLHTTKAAKCEVCVGVVNKLVENLAEQEKNNPQKIEYKLASLCREMKKAENRFCYYIGSLEESATKIVSELSKPLSWGLPAEKVCERLEKKDSQICELKYDKPISFKVEDLKTMRTRDLKKILQTWDEACDLCLEKEEFIRKIIEVMPNHVKQQ